MSQRTTPRQWFPCPLKGPQTQKSCYYLGVGAQSTKTGIPCPQVERDSSHENAHQPQLGSWVAQHWLAIMVEFAACSVGFLLC